jgi:hypothetical protein
VGARHHTGRDRHRRDQVIVEQEDPVLRIFSDGLPAKARQLTIRAEFLRRRGDYEVEVLATEAGGNQTVTEPSAANGAA